MFSLEIRELERKYNEISEAVNKLMEKRPDLFLPEHKKPQNYPLSIYNKITEDTSV